MTIDTLTQIEWISLVTDWWENCGKIGSCVSSLTALAIDLSIEPLLFYLTSDNFFTSKPNFDQKNKNFDNRKPKFDLQYPPYEAGQPRPPHAHTGQTRKPKMFQNDQFLHKLNITIKTNFMWKLISSIHKNHRQRQIYFTSNKQLLKTGN